MNDNNSNCGYSSNTKIILLRVSKRTRNFFFFYDKSQQKN